MRYLKIIKEKICKTEGESTKQVNQFKYLDAMVTEDGIRVQDIKFHIEEARQVLGLLNSVLWDKNISTRTKIHVDKTLFETVLCYN